MSRSVCVGDGLGTALQTPPCLWKGERSVYKGVRAGVNPTPLQMSEVRRNDIIQESHTESPLNLTTLQAHKQFIRYMFLFCFQSILMTSRKLPKNSSFNQNTSDAVIGNFRTF